jgi:putative oxidoreductase
MTTPLSRQATIVSWVAALAAAGILGMAAFFKFTGAPESRALFETLGVEPWGRYLVGLGELLAVLLLIRPATARWGGFVALALMLGAIGTHFTVLGINYQGDGGTLFAMAVAVLIAALVVVFLRRPQPA